MKNIANLKSSKKDAKRIVARTPLTHEYYQRVQNGIRLTEKAIASGDKAQAEKLYLTFQKNVDKAVQKKLVKKNTADRQKSRLFNKIKNMK